MSLNKVNRLLTSILDTSKALDSSIDRVEAKLEKIGLERDLKSTIKILEILEKFNKLRIENIRTIQKSSRAKKLLSIVREENEINKTIN